MSPEFIVSPHHGKFTLHPHDRPKASITSTVNATRAVPRGPQLGHLFFEGQSAAVPCTVASLTADGAVLAAPGWIGMPDRFSLHLRQGGLSFSCRIVSRRGSSARVTFEKAGL